MLPLYLSAEHTPPIRKWDAVSLYMENDTPAPPTSGHNGPTVVQDETYHILGGELNPCGGNISTSSCTMSQAPSGVLNIFEVNLIYLLVSLSHLVLLCFCLVIVHFSKCQTEL